MRVDTMRLIFVDDTDTERKQQSILKKTGKASPAKAPAVKQANPNPKDVVAVTFEGEKARAAHQRQPPQPLAATASATDPLSVGSQDVISAPEPPAQTDEMKESRSTVAASAQHQAHEAAA